MVEAGERGGRGGVNGGDMKRGKASPKPGATENHDDDDDYRDDDDEQQRGIMEEESQIVTFGEQYNPATGWTR